MLKTIGAVALIITGLIFCTVSYASTSLTYAYDSNGNLISSNGQYYEYNDANQLVKVRQGDQSGTVITEYLYDYAGQRIKKIENGLTTYYIGKHYEEVRDGVDVKKTDYYFANGERVAKKDSAGNMYYYHSDHLGGTNVVTNSSGNLVERINYYPFGEIREGGAEKYQFTGKEKDNLTDFNYYEARYYNSDFKHFTQADTVVPDPYNPQDLNRYAYAGNNPLFFIDPSGHNKVIVLNDRAGARRFGISNGHEAILIQRHHKYYYSSKDGGYDNGSILHYRAFKTLKEAMATLKGKDYGYDDFYSMSVSDSRADKMFSFAWDSNRFHEEFSIFWANCKDYVREVLHYGGYMTYDDLRPNDFMNDLERSGYWDISSGKLKHGSY